MSNNKRNRERINNIKNTLSQKYNIHSDRDLLIQLGISPEDKDKLFMWINYQNAYSYSEGYDNGQDEIKVEINERLDGILDTRL